MWIHHLVLWRAGILSAYKFLYAWLYLCSCIALWSLPRFHEIHTATHVSGLHVFLRNHWRFSVGLGGKAPRPDSRTRSPGTLSPHFVHINWCSIRWHQCEKCVTELDWRALVHYIGIFFLDFEMFQFHGSANVKSTVEVKFVLKRKSIRLVD